MEGRGPLEAARFFGTGTNRIVDISPAINSFLGSCANPHATVSHRRHVLFHVKQCIVEQKWLPYTLLYELKAQSAP